MIATALLVRAAVALGLLSEMPVVGDARAYLAQATSISASFPDSAPFEWPPGMSYLLAALGWAFGPSIAVARTGTVALGALGAVLTALLARQVLHRERDARLAGWIAALYAPAILLAGQPYPHHLAQVALVAAATLLLVGHARRSPWRFGMAGVFLGVAALARPSALSVVLVLLLFWCVALLWRKSAALHDRRSLVRWGAAASVGFFAVTFPVMAQHASLGQGWVLSTNNEWNFFAGNNRFTPNYKTSHLAQRAFDELPPETREYLESFLERPDARRSMMAEALRFIRENPGLTALRVLNRARAFWGFDYLASRLIQREYGLSNAWLGALLMLESGSYLAVMALVLMCGFVARNRLRPGPALLLVVMTGAYALPYLAAFAHGTYHFPVIALLIPFAAASLAILIERPRSTVRDLAGRPAAWAVIAVFAWIQIEYAWHAVAFR